MRIIRVPSKSLTSTWVCLFGEIPALSISPSKIPVLSVLPTRISSANTITWRWVIASRWKVSMITLSITVPSMVPSPPLYRYSEASTTMVASILCTLRKTLQTSKHPCRTARRVSASPSSRASILPFVLADDRLQGQSLTSMA